jgi:mannosyltransferase OCH1-like enzyme
MNIVKRKIIKSRIITDETKKRIHEIMQYKKLMKPFIFKRNYDSIIPLHLYTCWHTKDLPPLMQSNYNNLVATNPRITFHLYDENDCREFIKNNFEMDVLNAYDSLIPCSYKSDLWRFCVLYINGGIYMDIKYKCVNGFKFIALTEEETFVRDRPDECIYTALIATLPRNEIMLKCINRIVQNVKNKYYGETPLDPTGPQLLGRFFSNEMMNNLKLYFKDILINENEKMFIGFRDQIILTYYDNYREEQSKFQKNEHYSILWNEKNIYK